MEHVLAAVGAKPGDQPDLLGRAQVHDILGGINLKLEHIQASVPVALHELHQGTGREGEARGKRQDMPCCLKECMPQAVRSVHCGRPSLPIALQRSTL